MVIDIIAYETIELIIISADKIDKLISFHTVVSTHDIIYHSIPPIYDKDDTSYTPLSYIIENIYINKNKPE